MPGRVPDYPRRAPRDFVKSSGRFARKPDAADWLVSKLCSVQISGALSKTVLNGTGSMAAVVPEIRTMTTRSPLGTEPATHPHAVG